MKKLLWLVLLAFSFSVVAPAVEAASFPTAPVKAKALKKEHKKKKHHRKKHKLRKVAMGFPAQAGEVIRC